MKPRLLATLAVLAVTCVLTNAWGQDGLNRAPPFQAVRWVPEVQLDGRWYQVRSVDGVPVDELVEFIRRVEGERWTRRFAEDLVEMMTKMGRPPGATVRLVVRDVETGKERVLDNVPLTKANRDAILKRRDEGSGRQLPQFKPAALHQALDDFKAALDGRWSYRRANDADFDAAIATLRKRVDAAIGADEFGIELRKIVALGIDGHAGVTGYRLPPGGYLPFRVAAAGERVVALTQDRKGFLAEGFPYLTRIDGKGIEDWCHAASVLVPKGSPQYVRDRALRQLENLGYVRGLLALPKKATVEVEVAAAGGKARQTLSLPVAKSPTLSDVWPPGGSRVLVGNVGYLRLASMRREASVPEIKAWMPKFRDTRPG